MYRVLMKHFTFASPLGFKQEGGWLLVVRLGRS